MEFIISGVILFILLYVISPRGFSELLNHHMSWYCGNYLYLPLIRDIYPDLYKTLFYPLLYLVACKFLLFGYPWRNISVRDEYKYLFGRSSFFSTIQLRVHTTNVPVNHAFRDFST